MRNLRPHGWDQTYLLFESPRDMLVLDVVEAIGMTASAMLGLWWQGMAGAVAASAWATVLLAIFDAAWLRHRFGLKLPLAAYARVLVAVLALAALWWAAQQLGWRATPQAGPLLWAALAGGALYAAVLAAMFPRQSQEGWRLWRAL